MNEMLLSGILNKDEPLKAVDALLLALIGIAIVFVVLIVLMLIITIMGKIFDSSAVLKEKHPEWADKLQNAKSKMMFWKKSAPAQDDDNKDAVQQELAKGTCGQLKLVNTDERDAAMIMAIVADELQTPLNELRFVSIKRVEDEK